MPAMLEVPDLSHLTHEEQQKILDVIKRQQDEEKREQTLLRVLHDQFEEYKSQIKANTEESKTRSSAVEDNDPVCGLCFKTKIAEGCGHICAFCAARFCSRCGGRITIKSNKTMWVCNLCRKEKEILTRTGAWYHGDNNMPSKTSKIHQGNEKENIPSRLDRREERCMVEAEKQQILKQDSLRQVLSESPSQDWFPEIQDKTEMTTSEKLCMIGKVETSPDFQKPKSVIPEMLQSISVPNIPNAKKYENILKETSSLDNNVLASMHTSKELLESNSDTDAVMKNHLGDVERHQAVNLSTRRDGIGMSKPIIAILPESNSASSSAKTNCYSVQKRESSSRSFIYKGDGKKFGSLASLDDNRSTTDYSSLGEGDKETSFSDCELNLPETGECDDLSLRHNTSDFCANDYDLPLFSDPCPCHKYPRFDGRREKKNNSLQNQPLIFWQPSTDGRFLIGHLTLCKNAQLGSSSQEAGSLLGLKVVGGKTTQCGRLGAFVTKVRKGSLADTVGHLKPGDEIISWNKYCLQDATFDEVYEIVLKSKSSSIVELVVSRPIRDTPRIPETRLHQTAESSSCSLDSEKREVESGMIRSALGKVQIKMWYDSNTWQLFVTAMRAADLSAREGGLPRNPYLKMYLLPDRSNTFKRRTKTAKKTLSPEWLQTFVYNDVRKDDLGAMALELTLWDFDRSLEANNKFIGEVIIDLGLVCLNDEPHWFQLMPLGYGMNQDYEASTCTPVSASVVSSSVNLSDMSSGRAVNSACDLSCHKAIYSALLRYYRPCCSN